MTHDPKAPLPYFVEMALGAADPRDEKTLRAHIAALEAELTAVKAFVKPGQGKAAIEAICKQLARVDELEAREQRLLGMLKEAMPIIMQMVNVIKKHNETALAQTDGGGNG